MNPLSEQTMVAARYVTGAGKVTCICCDTESFENTGNCRHCQAPLDLSVSVNSRGTQPHFVPVLGASGAGKTVYVGMLLDILSKGTQGILGLPNNAFSVSVQEQTIMALENRRFPEKTPSESEGWQWVHCEVAIDKRTKDYVDIVTPDLAGEAIAMELEHPGTYPAIRGVVLKSAAIIVLVDSLRVRDGGSEEDFFATKLAAYVHSLHADKSRPKDRRKKLKLPLALILTKSDRCTEAFDNPSGFALDNMPGLVRYCDRNFACYRFFAAGVVGSSATVIDELGRQMQVPFHIEPRGVTDPLHWIIKGR